MKLPKISIGPIHTLFLKVAKKEITFRPFTVLEEKSILSAVEGDNTIDIIANYISIAESCVQEKLDWKKIALLDFMLISIMLRAKSQGETLSLQKKKCENCGKSFPFDINVEDSLTFENEKNLKKIVELDKNLKVEIVPLKIDYLEDLDNFEKELDIYISLISHSISKIFFKDEIYTNLSYEDVKKNCVNNLSKSQIKIIIKKIEKLISMKMVFNITCPHCKTSENLEISNFLEI